MRKDRLLTPGPTPVHPLSTSRLAAPQPHHRTPEFRERVAGVRRGLQAVFRTSGEVVLLTASGTGAMEAALINLTGPDDEVIVVNSGKFGGRWLEIGAAYGRRTVDLEPPRERPVSPQEVAEAVRAHPGARAFCFAACESSTGVRADTRELAAVARREGGDGLLVMVDAITELGAAPLQTEAWDLDVVVGGAQKAFMVPPGLAFLALSPRAEARLAETGGGGYYFNLPREIQAQRQGNTAWTPATALVAALEAALKRMLETGLDEIWSATRRRAEMTRAGITAMGLELFARVPAVSLTAVTAPPGLDSGRIVSMLEADYGVRIAGGQADLKGKIFRIAHLGYIDELETLGTLGALGATLKKMGAQVDPAAGLAAALEVMAGRR
jgi:aspartate aminotransferase-like enzyme